MEVRSSATIDSYRRTLQAALSTARRRDLINYKFISFVGFDMYHAMSSEQEAKSALNRPVPVPQTPRTIDAKQVLDGGNGQGSGSRGGSGGGAGAPGSSTPPPFAGPVAAGAGAAAGPIGAAAVVGGKAAKGATIAGPRAGSAVGTAAT